MANNLKITTNSNAEAIKIAYQDYSDEFDDIVINRNQLKICECVAGSEEIIWHLDGRRLRVARQATDGCMIIDDINGTTTWANRDALADLLGTLMKA